MKTIQDIFREVQPPDHSLSLARRYVTEEAVLFNGSRITSMMQEVEVVEGSIFQVGKRAHWTRKGDEWIRRNCGNPKDRSIQDSEGSLTLGEVYLVFPKSPDECGYVRIVNRHNLAETAYWDQNEWAEAPAEVMGAIIGAMCMGVRGTLR